MVRRVEAFVHAPLLLRRPAGSGTRGRQTFGPQSTRPFASFSLQGGRRGRGHIDPPLCPIQARPPLLPVGTRKVPAEELPSPLVWRPSPTHGGGGGEGGSVPKTPSTPSGSPARLLIWEAAKISPLIPEATAEDAREAGTSAGALPTHTTHSISSPDEEGVD